MKKTIILSFIFCIIISMCFAQETDSVHKPVTKQDYLQKAKSQRTTAFILLGAGAALDIAGIATTVSNANKEFGDILNNKKNVDHTWEYVFYIVGSAALFSSIPAFVAASRNKKHALGMSFTQQPVQLLANGVISNKPMPAVTISLSF